MKLAFPRFIPLVLSTLFPSLALAGEAWEPPTGVAVASPRGATATAVTPEIRNVTARQRYPWGKMDLFYEVTGEVPGLWWCITLACPDGTVHEAERTALSGETGVEEGQHHVVWDLDKQGVVVKSSNVVVSVTDTPMYCVIDLSAQWTASSYPVTYLDEAPSSGFNTDEYKMNKLVLRLVPPGKFQGAGQNWTSLSKPFYIGIFEVTQWQWMTVMRDRPSTWEGNMRPVENVSYDMIRGGAAGASWPASNAVDDDSFMGKLRAKTGLMFDLPTEAQWEYACRAGTTSDYNNGGNTENHLKLLARYAGNEFDGRSYLYTAVVGSYLPNAWGLYDMHGNVFEWCLDWHGDLDSNATDPKGASSGTARVQRGGYWRSAASECASSSREAQRPNWSGPNGGTRGLRLVCNLYE